MNEQLKEILDHIHKNGDLDGKALKEALKRQDILAKPPGALGLLEDISVQLAGVTGQVKNSVKKQAITIMSSDNGVCDEGVASAPQSVTLSQTINFTRRLTGVSAMAKYYNIPLLVIDLGVKMQIPSRLYTEEMLDSKGTHGITDKIVNRKITNGTKNLAKEPAMSEEQAVQAILTGFEAVTAFKKAGIELFGVGEMGIGNTTTSSCIISALTGLSAEKTVGRGGGLNDDGLAKKIKIVNEATKDLDSHDVLTILSHVGGYDICAMVGAYLGAAYYRIPVVIDGVISVSAALCAFKLAPKAKNFMFGSHKSKEPGYIYAMEALGLPAYFNLNMRLGEGSGCPISFKIIETATAAMNLMATFDEGAINAEYLEERKEGNFF